MFRTPMAFTSPVDFLGLYRMHATQQRRPLGHTLPARIDRFDQTGTMCKTSSDPIACKARVQALFVLHAQCPADEAKCTPFIVTTLGDDVRRIDDRAETIRLLGAIDSVEKAVIVAFWEGLGLRCWRNGYGAQVKHADAWYVQTVSGGCAGPVTRTMKIDVHGQLVSDTTVQPPATADVKCTY